MQERQFDSSPLSKGTEYRHAVLNMYFDYLNSRHREVRITAALAYIAGFTLLGILSLQVFGRVVFLLLQRLFGL